MLSRPVLADWYDYPQYYDLAFQDDTKPEADFLAAAFAKYAQRPVKRVLEPGCGGGRLIVELAKRGFSMVGFDTSDMSLDYLQKQLAKKKLKAEIYRDDMTSFTVKKPVDAAICTFNTFRHLTTAESARSHLQSVAASLAPGGIYILGLHLLPPDADEESLERWTATKGKTKVVFTLRVLDFNRRKRLEKLRATMLVRNGHKELRLASEFEFRLYTAAQIKQQLAEVPEFELCDVYDFCYEIDHPLKLDNELSDTVFILRKKAD
ncbi:class I SAM-dependent methyltransferase [Anatilimnocola floriformis]|uniref:class I SAM-dependent methyltransferase n=1 Tax=Anatilimnocola floriformis TaxID=2948575 RepID=UPI0020C5A695|nr:class I SAM-dependent methyltransferase [Anatilimnocola floriformis]